MTLFDRDRVAWSALAGLMVIAAVVILVAGQGSSFSGDELFYFGRLVDAADPPHPFGLEYLLLPANGHLSVAGRLLYEGMFAVFGADYFGYRVVEVLAVLLAVGLFFELVRPRIGNVAALGLCTVLLFLGAAQEVLLWPFDLHTALALAAGLAAVLVLERRGERGDPWTCVLLAVSIALIEVGLCFLLAVAFLLFCEPRRWRRIWVVLVPAALYAVWWVWSAGERPPGELDLANLGGLLPSLFDSLAAVLASVFGLIDSGEGVGPQTVGVPAAGLALAALALFGFGWAILRGRVGRTAAALAIALLTYWTMIALADRPPDSSRYVFVGAVLVFAIAALVIDRRPRTPAALALGAVLVALALPANIAKLFDGGENAARDAELLRSEYAMIELGGEAIEPSYVPGADEVARDAGSSTSSALSAEDYFAAAARNGSFAYDLVQVREQRQAVRSIADIVLANGLGLALAPATPPGATADCDLLSPAGNSSGVSAELPPQGAVIRSAGPQRIALSIGRFRTEGPSRDLGELGPGWQALAIPTDAAEDPWVLYAAGPLDLCPLGG